MFSPDERLKLTQKAIAQSKAELLAFLQRAWIEDEAAHPGELFSTQDKQFLKRHHISPD